MNKAFKFKIYPTIEQQIFFQKTFGCCRFIYNIMLSDKINFYKETKQILHNTPAQYKQDKEFEFLKEVDSLALANVQLNLNKAYKNFFRNPGKNGFPKFKSKKHDRKSYTTNNINNSIRIVDSKHIQIPKIKSLKVKFHRQIPSDYRIKSVTISQEPTGKYFISILTEYDYEIPKIELDKNNSIGLDYSSPDFYIDSNGNKPNYPRFFREYEEQLAKEQRKLSHMKLHSNNYFKQLKKVNLVHEKIKNARKDFIEKLSTQLANTYDIICVEDLNMKNIAQSLHLGKSTNDNGFGIFKTRLQQKLEYQGKKLIKINKWFPSSKTCNSCRGKYDKLQLSDRIWVCPNCGEVVERDLNAAKNILEKGLELI